MTPIMKHIKIDHRPNALTLVFQMTDNLSRSLKIQQRIIITIDTATPVDNTTVIVVALGDRNNALTSPQMINIIPIRKHSYERLPSSTHYLLNIFKYQTSTRLVPVVER